MILFWVVSTAELHCTLEYENLIWGSVVDAEG